MSLVVREEDLAVEISAFEAVELAYPEEITRCHQAIGRGLPVMIECDKELVPYFYRALRSRLRNDGRQCIYLDGRPDPNAPRQGGMPQTLIGTIIGQLREAVRGAVDERVVVLPHLDLLTTSTGGLTGEAREVIPLLYENPNLLWIGFKDPSFPLPKVILNLFPHHESIIGVGRNRLAQLVTQREARKFGREFNPFALYKHVSGQNAVRLRRLLSSVQGEDYPDDPKRAYEQLRSGTLSAEMTVPEIDVDTDIGGYGKVKDRLKKEILQILAFKDSAKTAEEVAHIEKLIPKGMIFWGPPGTGKTLFAKAMATSLGAAVQIVSGPELKSRWVGESEENIRRVFMQARKSAPSIIVFDELDSIAPARGTYTGSGVEHSMVNQLLTELDGFRSTELVFVVGTTNFPESLDPALLRPGRFEFHLQIPFPGPDDRRAIFEIYDKKLRLNFSERALDYAVKRTDGTVEGQNHTLYTGDHIMALCRALARRRIRDGTTSEETTPEQIETALTEYTDRPDLTTREELVIATHECGHAIVGLYCKNLPGIDRISIRGDLGAPGFVQHKQMEDKYIVTEGFMLDRIAMSLGGREAERLILGDISQGAAADLDNATSTAEMMVLQLGMGPREVGQRQYKRMNERQKDPDLADETKVKLDEAILQMITEQQDRAAQIITDHREELLALRKLLLEKKVIDATTLRDIAIGPKKKKTEDQPQSGSTS